ncbi:hypothetical protein LXA43DRAFT_535766 [Ganoderma leucocontextum]|nr:hypothetical protein LXA43DRAFT_535766 [Ganoderma leucocontextum]
MDPGNSTHDLDFFLNGVVRTAIDVRDENLRLKAENERLERVLSEIIPELELLRKERGAFKAAVRVLVLQSGVLPPYISQKPATFTTLPYEVLQPIFTFAAAEPTYQFDPSIQPGSYGPWLQLMRMKKGFPLICRASFWPGMSVLYSDIVLRRMGQVSALAETLRTADVRAGVGKLIKSIRWDSCVVAAPCAHVIREDLTFIFGQCTQLQSFSYRPHHNFPQRYQTPDRDGCEGFFNPLWFIMMPSSALSDPPLLQSSAVPNLRFLDMSVDLEDDASMLLAIHRVLPTFKALESLALGRWSSNSLLLEEVMRMPSISLPFLTDLRIFAPEGPVDTYLCSRWNAPQLTRLTVLTSAGWSPIRHLERFGSRLRYLHLYPIIQRGFHDYSAYLPTQVSSMLTTLCPLLEHLVVPHSGPLYIDSPTLAHLDLWTTSRQRAEDYRVWTVDARSNAPSLRTVRFIFTASNAFSWSSGCKSPDWPWICHPRLLAEGSDEVLYHRFPLGRVAQTVAAIIPEDVWQMSWEGAEFEAGEDWPGVYGDLGELQRRVDEEGEESEWGLRERGARGEETSSSDWTSDDDSEEEGDGDSQLKDHDTVIGANVEGTDGSQELQVEQRRHMDLDGGDQPQHQEEERADQEGDGEVNRRQLEAATELVSPEYPVAQLDRATVLNAFRRGRDRESYNHADLWDHY